MSFQNLLVLDFAYQPQSNGMPPCIERFPAVMRNEFIEQLKGDKQLQLENESWVRL